LQTANIAIKLTLQGEKIFSYFYLTDLQALGMESGAIANNKIEASTEKVGYEGSKGRLNGNSCWKPTQNKNTESIKVTFTAPKTVIAIATQGAPNDGCWVTSYTLQWYQTGSLKTDPKVKTNTTQL